MKSIEAIHRRWQQASTEADLRSAVREMITHPSQQWRHYLDDLYLAERHRRTMCRLETKRYVVLKDFEDELYGSVAEAISRANGVIDAEQPPN